MAAKPINPDKAATIVAEWRTGEYSQQDLAVNHKVSKGIVNKLCKGVVQDTAAIVTAGIQYKQGLASHDDRNVTAVTAVVNKRVQLEEFFTCQAVENVKIAMRKLDNPDEVSIFEHKALAETIQKGKETALGRDVAPATAVQINTTNNVTGARKMQDLTEDELFAIIEAG